MFYIPDSVSVDAPRGVDEDDFFGLEDFRLQNDILGLIDGGEDDIWKLDICLAEESLGDILTVVNRLVGLNVIKEEGEKLSLSYADVSLKEFTPAEETTPAKSSVFDASGEIVRLVGSGIQDLKFLRGHFPTVPTHTFSATLDKLLEDGTVIKQPDGELILGR